MSRMNGFSVVCMINGHNNKGFLVDHNNNITSYLQNKDALCPISKGYLYDILPSQTSIANNMTIEHGYVCVCQRGKQGKISQEKNDK